MRPSQPSHTRYTSNKKQKRQINFIGVHQEIGAHLFFLQGKYNWLSYQKLKYLSVSSNEFFIAINWQWHLLEWELYLLIQVAKSACEWVLLTKWKCCNLQRLQCWVYFLIVWKFNTKLISRAMHRSFHRWSGTIKVVRDHLGGQGPFRRSGSIL